jgi:hypothetical protein
MLCDPDGSRAATAPLLVARPWYFDSRLEQHKVDCYLHLPGLCNSQSNSFLTDYDKH